MAKVISIESGRFLRKPQQYQSATGGNDKHIRDEVVRRWDRRQSIEKIVKSMRVGSLYVQDVLRDRAILCPPTAPARKAA